jgi:hypothetical protein
VDAGDLYGLPLERFVAQRTALSRELRAEGRRAEAAEIARLRKPSVAAWAVNQLVRTQGASVRELFGAGDRLREAHQRAVSGRGDGEALRAAAEQERAAVDALVSAARGLLTSDGHELSPAIVDRVSETLHAGALEDHARDQVRDGRLERELRHVGLGDPSVAGAGAATTPAPEGRRDPKRAETEQAEAGRAGRERTEERRAARERAKARESARNAEAAAKRGAARAARAVQAGEERRERAARALRDADEALATARAEAEAAVEAHRDAKDTLDGL